MTWNRSVELLHAAFEAQARRQPDAVAVIAGGTRLTYAELEARANRLAHHLRALGVGPEVRVGLCLERAEPLVVAILGVLKAGGAYVPLDPAYPVERLAFLLEDSRAPVLVTQERLLSILPDHGAHTVLLDVDAPRIAAHPATRPEVSTEPRNLAYLIYTSGSTGRPKGVAIAHHSAAVFVRWSLTVFAPEELTGVLLATSVCFDLSIFELFVPLSQGGTMIVAGNALDLPSLPAAAAVTLVNTVPSALAELVRQQGIPPSVRVVNLAGEALPGALVDAIYRGTSVRRVFNLYGPSEDTTYSTFAGIEPGAQGEPPIGRPIAGTRAYLLDEAGNQAAPQESGELFLGGLGLARGYLHRPDLTAERFVPDRFTAEPGSRVYRTGDLARYLPDGDLHFLGRADHQVKIRGFRIELGEVEAALSRYPALREVAVAAREDGGAGKTLVAYLAADPPLPGARELREFLLATLPAYMVPSLFVLLDALPRTPNGKIDRKALPPPGAAGNDLSTAYVAPRTPLEEQLAAIWGEVLGCGRVGLDDPFFALGGHSLLATRVLSRVRDAFGVELPMRALFAAPTVGAMAERVEAARGSAPEGAPLVPVPRERFLPLAPVQVGPWLLNRMEPGLPSYDIPSAVELRGPLDPAALAGALTALVERHESLRTRLPEVDWEPWQEILPPAPQPLPLIDLAALPGDRRVAELERVSQGEARRCFDLDHGPLLATTLVRLAVEDHRFLFVVHHIVFDGWSEGVFWRELSALYAAAAAGQPSPLPALRLQYADYAVWQRRRLDATVLDEQIEWWRRRLTGVPPLDLPTDRPRPPVRTSRGAVRRCRLPAPLAGAVREAARRQGTTPFMALLGTFAALLSRYSGQEDFAVGLPVAGRGHSELEGMLGLFVNVLVLRADLSGRPAFHGILERVREAALAAFAQQDVPFDRLVNELNPERDLARNAIFQVSFQLVKVALPLPVLPGVEATAPGLHNGTSKLDLDVEVEDRGPGMGIRCEYSADLFDAPTLDRLFAHFGLLVESGIAEPDRPLADLPLLLAAEHQQVLVEWNDTRAPLPFGTWVHQLVAAHARRAPDALAVVRAERQLSYGELDRRAARLARTLSHLGIGPEVKVGLCLERSPELVISALAVLKAGGSYVALDPLHPEERLAFQLTDCQTPVLLTQRGRVADLAARQGIQCLFPHEPDLPDLLEPGEPPAPALLPGNLAYVIYTSGSTGRPKGVEIGHRSLLNLVEWYAHLFHLTAADRGTVLAGVGFDASVFEIWPYLARGASLHLVPDEVRTSAEALPGWLTAQGITVSFMPPLLAEAVLDREWQPGSALRFLLCGGDRLHQAPRPSLPFALINAYGPTEGTVVATAGRVPAREPGGKAPTLGRPITNVRANVFDRGLRPMPVGVPGELLVGGTGLARGYLRRPELTAERFVPDPFAGTPGERLYRTGDLVRLLPDGELEFLGRIDHQVKIRGYRIELGEIETVLARHPAVREVAVLPVDGNLVAYFTGTPEVAELRAFLRRELPDSMVPAGFVPLSALPLSASGKVDRQALSRIQPAFGADGGTALSLNPAEELIANLWEEVLGRSGVGAGDNFFHLGGHSLLITRVLSRLRETFGVDLPVKALFESPTVGALARVVTAPRQAADEIALPPLLPVPRGGLFPLSFPQQRLWFLDRLAPDSSTYNIPLALRLHGIVNPEVLAGSFGEVVRRHEMLRTRFVEVEGQPWQEILPPEPVPLPRIDLGDLPARRGPAELARLAGEEAGRPFDLGRGPLLRARLIHLAGGEHALLLTLHHLTSDGWSEALLLSDLSVLYTATVLGRPSPLPELPLHYVDFAVWQRAWPEEVFVRQLAYWRRQMAGAPAALPLPTDRPRPAVQSFRGATRHRRLPASAMAELRGAMRREGVTLYMLLLAGYQALLARYSGQEDILVGTPVANRTRPEIERLIGFFVNTLVLRERLAGVPDFRRLSAAVRETALAAFAHQDLPFEMLVEELRPERDRARNPLVQVLLALQSTGSREVRGARLGFTPLPLDQSRTAKFDLTLAAVEDGGELELELEFATDLFTPTTAVRLLEHFANLLTSAVRSPERPLSQLSLLSAAERQQALVEWNDTHSELSSSVGMHQLVAAHARRAPAAPAVVTAERRLSYGELDRQAGRLARALSGLGVGPEVRVGLCLERSPELVISALAVLKAGGAYVALDPLHPEERLAFELADCRAPVLLTRRGPVADLAARLGIRCLFPHEIEEDRPAVADVLPEPAFLPDGLAYVIYTSGSTGRPKGVEIRHRSLLNLVAWHVRTFGLTTDDRGTLLAGVGFDASVWESWPYLAAGASLHLVPEAIRTSAEKLPGWLAEQEITVSFLPTPLAEAVLDQEWPTPSRSALRFLLTGGDRLHASPPPSLPFILVNDYGPTEATVVATSGPVAAGRRNGPAPSLGRSIANTRAYVLDRELQPVPLGVPGELLLGGTGLARGYLGLPALTAERFLPDPFAGADLDGTPGARRDLNGALGARLYRTGDLVRLLPGGEVEFLGRVDQQVKIRGYRVELGEIETVLSRHPAVREVAVLALDGRLVAYFTAATDLAAPADLSAFLRRALPDFMVPASFVLLPALPLSSSGKVDRQTLAQLRPAAEPDREAALPRTPTEELLASLWEEVLGSKGSAGSERSPVGVDDNFFHLGGHSLLVTRVLARIREAFQVDLPVQALFESPTLRDLAGVVTVARRKAEAIPLPPLRPVPPGGLLPLSFPQQRLWFIDRLAPDSSTYNIPAAFRLRGALDSAALAASLDAVVRRHEVLRTRFVEVDGQPWQEILPPVPVPFPRIDLAGLPEARREAELARLGWEEAGRPFDLGRGPLLRARRIRLGGGEHALLLTLHHVAADGWSVGLLFAELSALYGAATQAHPSPLPAPTIQYADFAVWQRAWPPEVLAGQLDYWRRHLADLATLEVATDRPRPPVQTFRGDVETVTVPVALTTALRALAHDRRVTLFMTLLAAWQALFHRLTGQTDVVVGSPVANRTHRETEGLIGFFVNLLALRADCGGDPSFGRLLERVRRTALLAYDHADLPFERLVDELALGRDLSRQPLVQVMFALESAPPTPLVLAGLTVSPLDFARAVAKFDLTLALFDRGDELAGEIEYSTDLFDRATVQRLAGHFVHLLAAVAADPEARLSGVELLSTAERHQLVGEWNDTAAPFAPVLLHQPFESAAVRTPGALAAVCAGEELTYGELEARSNRLAHLLRDRGLERGEPVGVWMERSLDMLVAVLGALKAGGFYVPLDAAWPAERVESILAATGTRALLAGGGLLSAVEEMQWRLPALSDVVCLAVAGPRLPPEALDLESVRGLWDYVAERAVDRVTAGGFVSAWTGLPFKESEVDEYRDRVLTLAGPWLQPSSRILEIGSGAGLLLWEMASRVAHAVGIDPSPLTQEKNRARAAREGLDNVDLRTGFAHELDALLPEDARFDLILLASTVQFFPGPRYLEQVVARALSRLAPGGALLIADVLDARRRDELQRRIAEHRGKPPSAIPGRGRELYLDEDLFRDLGAVLPEVGEVAVLHRTEGFDNELGWRYDVLFTRAPEALSGAAGRAPGERRRHLWTAWHTARRSAERPPQAASDDDIAYVIYTSGSTGAPKGIVVQHRSAAHLVDWVDRTFGVGPADRVLFVTSLCFDLSVYDLFGVLAAGGTVHVATEEELGDPDRMVRLLCGGTITLWDSAPAALVQLAPLFPATPDPASRLRLVLLSGDWIPVTLPDRVRTAFPGARVVSLGGATEATVWSNWYPIGEVDPRWPSIPYGRPIENARYLVLDAGFAPCPIGVPGDLYIGDLGDAGGACLSVGYAHEPGLTAAGFLPDPFAAEPGRRLYRTGDQARFGADGSLEFLGRIDQQVKVRGFRIELGEIEVALARHPEVREAVVLAREDRPGDRRLVAYVVPAGQAARTGLLRELLRQVLPEYMVPAAFVFLDALPVTANGKLDRKALPVPHLDEPMEADGSWVPPRTPTEELLAGLWREILGVERVGVHDSFFALGGHSLLATQLMARLREVLEAEVPLRALFQRPTLADLAVEVEAIIGLSPGLPAGAALLRPIPRDGELPLSFSQLRQWFLVQLEPESTLYNLPLTLRLSGPLAVAPLERSLDEIVRRHESLRSTYSASGGRPVQVIAPELTLPLPRLDLGGLPVAAREAESRRLIQAEGAHPFDLARGPLLHASLLRLAAEEHFLLVTVHHIAFDGWSLGVFTNELAALYQAFDDGLPSPLPELAVQYVDYASWQRQWLAGEEAGRQIDYWRSTLAGAAKMLHLATDRPRPAVQTFRGAFEMITFPAPLAANLHALGLAEGATLYMTLLAGFCVLLQRYSRQDDLNLGTFVANRRLQAVEPLLGLFVNTLVLRANLAGEPSFRELLARLRETTLGAYENQDIPFEMLLDSLETARDLSRTPLFQVMFGLQNFAVPRIELPRLEIAPVSLYEGGRANFDLALWAWEESGVLHGVMQYNVDLFEPATIRRMLSHLTDLLAEATEAPDRRVDALRLLTAGELHQVVHEWSGGEGDGAEIRPVHEGFALQAARTPDAAAVVQEDRVLTYAELARRAGSLARSLRALGVGPESVVGLSSPRSLEMIIGLFGVLQAGGAYLPLDPSLPDERIAFLLTDAGAVALLTAERLADRRLDFPGPVVFLEQERKGVHASADAVGISGAGAGARADHLAYVLYTSGSTGRPKGVLIDQGSLASFARSAIEAFALRPGDRMLQFASLAFDTSAEEIYPTLLAGATLVLRTEAMHSSPALFFDTCRDWEITVLDLPTAYWHVLAAEVSRSGAAPPHAVRAVILGGERALPERVRGWFETVGSYPLLFNTYGPTEATVVSTGGVVRAPAAAGAGATVPIGRPMPNARLSILDASLNPVPIGVAGELHITGRGLARGYSGRPDLTARSFIPSPFGAPGSRLYRSGDLVRYLPDGALDFVGRIDDQVKIRGFRVEPGEIATLLTDHPAVREAAVLATTSAAGDWRLTAYFVAGGPPAPTPEDLRDFLKTRLPAYMVPSDYLALPAMPMTATGKLDRAALPAPDRERDDGYVAPTTVSEELLADIWRALLDRERVSIYDNFFDLGGHSLLAPQLMARIEEVFQVELPLRLLFESPTVAQLAVTVEGALLAEIESLDDEDVAVSEWVEKG